MNEASMFKGLHIGDKIINEYNKGILLMKYWYGDFGR